MHLVTPNNRSFRLFLVLFGSVSWPSTTMARTDDFSALVIGTSNYFYRGYSKSDNGPTVRANVDYAHRSGLYGGMWISRVDFGYSGNADPVNVEFYPYVGYTRKIFDDWRGEASVTRYVYDGRFYGKAIDYNEYGVALHYSDLLSVRIDFADNAYNRGHHAENYEMSGRYPLWKNLVASSGIGFNKSTPTLDYDWLSWNVGLTWFFPHGGLDLRYVDNAVSSHSGKPDAISFPELKYRYVISLTVGF